MLFMGISIAVFVVALVGFVTMLGLWTYADAKVRTDKPGIWTLIVLFVPNLLGLIIYLLVGRTKMEKSPGYFKKPLISFALCFVLASVLMIGSFIQYAFADGFEIPWGTSSGVFVMKVENYWDQQWTISVMRANGNASKTVNLDETELSRFHVTGNCESGKIYLNLLQGDAKKTIEISDSFEQSLDLREFKAGKVKVRIEFADARNANVAISWRE